jgi:lipopolysaccharide transport system permease protein
VLVFVFSRLLDLGIEDFPVFVFTGLLAWTWFTTGVTEAATSLLAHRHLLFQSRFPALTIPLVAVAVPVVDVVLALPVLAVLLAAYGELHATALLLPLALLVQFVLMVGIAWLTATASVFLRDVPNLVGLVLGVGFYLTPVFYDRDVVPDDYRWVLDLNPLATLIELDRALLLGTDLPAAAPLAGLLALTAVVAVAGWLAFRAAAGVLVDHV